MIQCVGLPGGGNYYHKQHDCVHQHRNQHHHRPQQLAATLTTSQSRCSTATTGHQCKFKLDPPPTKLIMKSSWLKKLKPQNSLSSSVLVLISIAIVTIILVEPQQISSEFTSSGNNIISQHNKNSGHYTISQLCAGKSQFPSLANRVEGAVLSSNSDTDVNCTITFKTKSNHQHFVIRFEELKLGCDDHLKMFDGDSDYGQPSIKDFSCRDSLASVPIMKTTSTYLTMRFSSDSRTKLGDGFRLVVTAVYDFPSWDCPVDYSLCSNRLCIARSLFCDDVNHCLDNSDEASCSSRPGIDGSQSSGGPSSSFFAGDLTLSNALGLLIVLVLVIFTCVIIFIMAIYCRRESHYAQYQHHLQRAIGVPLQTSSSLMFANHHPHQPQYHYFQPAANFSPYITPQHHAQLAVAAAAAATANPAATTNTLPRGYSTLPLNLASRQPMQQMQLQPHHQLYHHQQQPPILAKPNYNNNNNNNNNEYLMMAGLTGPPTAAMQASPTTQTNLIMPTSQSILTTSIK